MIQRKKGLPPSRMSGAAARKSSRTSDVTVPVTILTRSNDGKKAMATLWLNNVQIEIKTNVAEQVDMCLVQNLHGEEKVLDRMISYEAPSHMRIQLLEALGGWIESKATDIPQRLLAIGATKALCLF